MPSTSVTRRRRSVVRALAGTLAFSGVVGVAAFGIAGYLDRLDLEPVVVRCSAAAEGTAWHLETDQAETVALLAATSLRRGLPARATTVAIATGLQESKLRNIEHGDRDSVGIFQQRPSQGWGTVEQILDPVYSTNAFYDALVQVDGYEQLRITEAAQAVQRSGFPDAYAQHEARSRAWASGMYGYDPAAVTCTLRDAQRTGDPAAVLARVERDFGALPTSVDAEGAVLVDAAGMATGDDDARLGWALAHWAVTVAEPLDIVSVEHQGHRWDRATGTWELTETQAGPAGRIAIALAG